jgi:hypothetical protein
MLYTRPPMTLGNMRENGVRALVVLMPRYRRFAIN